MRIADLNQRLVIEQAVDTADGAGGVARTWCCKGHVWAALSASGGGARNLSDRPELAGRYRAILRWRPGLDGTCRLRQGERVFAILSVLDPDGRRRWLTLGLEEVTP